MSEVFSNKCNKIPGIYVNRRGLLQEPVIFWDKCTTGPTTSSTTNAALWVNSSGNLVFGYNGTDTVIGAPGAAATTWEQLYLNDTTFAMTTGTWAITHSHATSDAISMTKSAGTGALLTLANSGTGNDITGPAWSIISTGSVGILELTSGGTINAAGGALTIGLSGTATTFAGTVTIDETSTFTGAVTATASVTVTGAAGSNCLVVTAGDAVMTEGSLTMTDDDNATTLSVTNDGATSADGVVKFLCDKLTSGTLLNLSLDESALSGGYFVKCVQTDASATVFSIAEDGATVFAGSATGTAVVTLTAGDLALSDGVASITNSGDSATLTIVADAATDKNVIDVNADGVTTGVLLHLDSTSASFAGKYIQCYDGAADDFSVSYDGSVAITSTGTGATPLTIAANSATTVTNGLVNIDANAITTGIVVKVDSTSADVTSGRLMSLNLAASSAALANKAGSLVDIGSSRTYSKTSDTVADDYDVLALTKTAVTTGAGGTLTSAGSVLYISTVVTQTAGTLTDTTNGIEISMDADGTGDGVKITHANAGAGKSLNITSSGTTSAGAVLLTANAITTGQGMLVNANGLTQGQALSLAHTTSVITTGSVLKVSSTGVDTGTGQGTLAEFISSGAQAAVVVRIAATALTSGVGLQVLSNTLTTGQLVSVAHTTGVIANGGTLMKLSSTSIDTATSSGCLLDLAASASTAGTQVLLTSSATTSGIGISAVLAALTSGTVLNLSAASISTGYYIKCLGAAGATMFTVGVNGAVVIAGSAAETDALTITAGDLSLTTGLINLESAAGTAVGNAVTVSKATGTITSSTNNLAAATSETITLTNTRISASSHVIAWIEDGGTGGQVCVLNCKPGTGSATISVRNVDAAAAMSSTYKVGFLVINK